MLRNKGKTKLEKYKRILIRIDLIGMWKIVKT